jgi:preprotein translocase subunit SecF
MANLQSNYEEKINLATIKEKENALLLQKEINIRQRVQTVLISLLAGLLLALIILLYRNYQRKVKFEQLLEQKVQNRTHELEASRYELERINAEQNSLILKTYADNRSILASAKGIYQAALSDITDPGALDYISKMNEVTHQIENSSAVLLKKIDDKKDKN